MGIATITASRKILVVDDESLIRLAAITIVEDLGYEALEAESAEEAIAILERVPHIRVVLTDINMAGSMDGLQLVAYAHDRWPPLKFVVVSGAQRPPTQGMPEDMRFFPKPYDAVQMSRILQEIVEGGPAGS